MTVTVMHATGGLIPRFCTDCRLRGMSDETIRGYRSNLRIFYDYMTTAGQAFTDVDNHTLQNFLAYIKDTRRVTQKTVEQYFTALSTLYDYLVFEGITEANTILPFRRRYIRTYKHHTDHPQRQLLSIPEMSTLINAIIDPRNKAIAVLLAKTGIRRGEMLTIDVEDINWDEYSIMLKPTRKRSNLLVFFDDECAHVLKRWLRIREQLNPSTPALFISTQTSKRLSRNGAYHAIVKYAKRLGFHNSQSPKLKDHFGPHCFRHWFTTFLLRNGMKREYVKELRGDKRKDAIDIYHHIDREELRRMYLACIPKLGI